jgi:hypothetical protein
MPLHDWTDRSGWDGVHHLWITELLRWVKPRLPSGYRAYIGTVPTVAIGAPPERPDVAVRQWPQEAGASPNGATSSGEMTEPDQEVAVATLDPAKAMYVESQGKLVAAVELISPRNKDRTISRSTYAARYVGYLLEGVHLLLVDVHPRPLGFSFADAIAQELQMPDQPRLEPPLAVAYRVGEPAATGGRLLGVWRRSLSIGQPLPPLPLPLTVSAAVDVDLEQTYQRAAADAYLE